MGKINAGHRFQKMNEKCGFMWVAGALSGETHQEQCASALLRRLRVNSRHDVFVVFVSMNSLYLFTMCCVINLRHTFIHFIYLCEGLWVHLPRHMCGGQRLVSGAITLHLCFWNGASHRAWGSPVCLGCLSNQWAPGTCLPSLPQHWP